MANAFFTVPKPVNEPVYSYAPNTPERALFKSTLAEMKARKVDLPLVINGEKIYTDNKHDLKPPYELSHHLGVYSQGSKKHVQQAIDAALGAKEAWESMPWQDRAAIFLRAADLVSGPYRQKLNAATMLAQSKNIYQAEVDAVCELADFFRFNVHFMTQIYKEQPLSVPGQWNRVEYRPLEGFVFAITPFNFTAIAGNLPGAPAMLGNTVVWKPADSQIYSAALIMEIFEEAGLPPGVINLVYCDGPEAGDVIFNHPDLAGLHFTGSTGVFKHLWKTIGNNIDIYKSYPRIVGETGGKDFVVAHPTAKSKEIATALARGAFEYQGQKCSAASRAYIPNSLKDDTLKYLKEDVASFKLGTPEDFGNFVNAVIDERSFDKIAGYLDYVKQSDDASFLIGGGYDKSKGYYIEPTVIVTTDPKFKTMCEEIFGPVLTIYCYEDEKFEDILHICNETSNYALTGSIFSNDRQATLKASHILRHAAGNYYINDKPTGSIVGQQPFGGARGSGTNDKAGSMVNLYRWISARSIKETFVPPTDYRYPFLES